MGIKYVRAPDIQAEIHRISDMLGFAHVDHRVICIRSHGSRARYTLARCHAMSRVMSIALGVEQTYVIEVINETFDQLDPIDKTKTLIHEILHIPKSFGGGLKGHRNMRRTVEKFYKQLKLAEKEDT